MTRPINTQSSIPANSASNYFKQQQIVVYREKDHKNAPTIKNVAWNSTGTRIAAAYTDSRIRVWISGKTEVNTSTEILYSSSEKTTKAVVGLAWSPVNPDQLVSASIDGSVKVWDTKTKTLLASVLTGADNLGCWWSPCGEFISVLRKDNVVVWYRSPEVNGEIQSTQRNSRSAPNVAVGHLTALGNPVAVYKEPLHEIFSASWTNTTEVMAITLGTGVVKLLKLNFQGDFSNPISTNVTSPNVSLLFQLAGHTSAANCVKPDPQGRYIAVGGNEGVVSLWETKELVCIKTLCKHDQPVVSLDFSHDGDYLAIGYDSNENPLDIVHVETGEFVHSVTRPRWSAPPIVAWSPVKYNLAFSGDAAGLNVVTSGGSRPSGY